MLLGRTRRARASAGARPRGLVSAGGRREAAVQAGHRHRARRPLHDLADGRPRAARAARLRRRLPGHRARHPARRRLAAAARTGRGAAPAVRAAHLPTLPLNP
ncbi:hypothetical protein V2I01_14715 [Micromonospora sp. BRA006-A]|nr:hypothetical protein [Micromonospora sp. BRA006-A]